MSTALLFNAYSAQLVPLLRLLAACSAIGAVLLAFRPLLTGLARAAWLVAFPRLSREQRLGRDQMRDQRVIARLIASSTGPSLTAELRAMAARD